jgi:hypothetical protein
VSPSAAAANITSVVGNLSGTIAYIDNSNRYFLGQIERIDPNRNLVWSVDAPQSKEAYRTLLCTLDNYATLAIVFQNAPFITAFTATTPAYPQICTKQVRDYMLHLTLTITYDDGHIQPVSITRTAKAGVVEHTASAPNLVIDTGNITELLTLLYNTFQHLGISVQLQYAGVTVPHLSRRQTRKIAEAKAEPMTEATILNRKVAEATAARAALVKAKAKLSEVRKI